MGFRTGAIGLGTGLIVIVVGILWYRAHQQSALSAIADRGLPEASAQATSENVQRSPRPAVQVMGALPPPDRSVADMFDELKQRADRGDALASCRLAVELIECKQVALLMQADALVNMESAENELAAAGEPVAADGVAQHQMQVLEFSKRCKGLDEGQRKLASVYLGQAARAGIGEAMIRYAEGQGLDTGNSMFGMLRDPAFDQWRRDAPQMLYKALQGGEPSAATILMLATSDDNSLIGGLIADDAVQAYSYQVLVYRLRGKAEPSGTGLTPSQVADAKRKAARMHATFFNGAIFRDPRALASPLTPGWAQPAGAAIRPPCETRNVAR